MSGQNNESFNYKQISADTSLTPTAISGVLGGIFVSAASATPTITVYDSTTLGGTKIIDTFTPVAGTGYAFPASFSNGLFIDIGGTVSCTVFWC